MCFKSFSDTKESLAMNCSLLFDPNEWKLEKNGNLTLPILITLIISQTLVWNKG